MTKTHLPYTIQQYFHAIKVTDSLKVIVLPKKRNNITNVILNVQLMFCVMNEDLVINKQEIIFR